MIGWLAMGMSGLVGFGIVALVSALRSGRRNEVYLMASAMVCFSALLAIAGFVPLLTDNTLLFYLACVTAVALPAGLVAWRVRRLRPKV